MLTAVEVVQRRRNDVARRLEGLDETHWPLRWRVGLDLHGREHPIITSDGGTTHQSLVYVRQNTAAGDRRPDEGVQLFVTSNGELQVTGSDALHSPVRNIGHAHMQEPCVRRTSPWRRCLRASEMHADKRTKSSAPASSRTSAVRYSRIAEQYTAALAPIRMLY